MNKIKGLLKNSGGILISVIEIVAGILLLVDPTTFISYIVLIAGAILVVSGIISATKYFVSPIEEAQEGQGIFKALVSASLGVFLMINNKLFVSDEAEKIISFVFGAAILLIGFSKLQGMFDKIRKNQFFFVSLASAALTIICAIIIITGSLGLKVLWIFAGVSLVIEALVDVADMVTVMVISKKKAAAEEPIEAAAEDTPATE